MSEKMIYCKNICVTEDHLLPSSIIVSIELVFNAFFKEDSTSSASYSDWISRNDMLAFFPWRDRITACLSGSDVWYAFTSLLIIITSVRLVYIPGPEENQWHTTCSGIRIWTSIVLAVITINYIFFSILWFLSGRDYSEGIIWTDIESENFFYLMTWWRSLSSFPGYVIR